MSDEVLLEIRYSESASPMLVCESIYHEVTEMNLHDFGTRTILCSSSVDDIPVLRKIRGVTSVELTSE